MANPQPESWRKMRSNLPLSKRPHRLKSGLTRPGGSYERLAEHREQPQFRRRPRIKPPAHLNSVRRLLLIPNSLLQLARRPPEFLRPPKSKRPGALVPPKKNAQLMRTMSASAADIAPRDVSGAWRSYHWLLRSKLEVCRAKHLRSAGLV